VQKHPDLRKAWSQRRLLPVRGIVAGVRWARGPVVGHANQIERARNVGGGASRLRSSGGNPFAWCGEIIEGQVAPAAGGLVDDS